MNLQNPKFTLVAIATLFLVPLLVAVLMRSSWWNFEPSSFANRGILLDPPLALALDSLEFQYSKTPKSLDNNRQWILLYPVDPACAGQCLLDLAKLRQIHLATGRKRDRVAIWILGHDPVPAALQDEVIKIYQSVNILTDSTGEALSMLGSIARPPDTDGDQPAAGQVFLLDPATNIILRYTPGFDPNDIEQDLDRLLTWSSTN